MQVHARAALSPIGRRRVVDRVRGQGWSVTAAAEAAGVTERTVYRWLARFRVHGASGLVDRRPVPRRVPARTPADRVTAICELRQLRLTAAEISERLAMPLSTVSIVLKREGLGKRSRLEPPEPVNRYERRRPGELVHIDVKKLGRIQGGPGKRVTGRRERWAPTRTDAEGVARKQIGWECVHVAVDDFSRLAYVEVLSDERAPTAVGFLERALRFYAGHGIRVERVMTTTAPLTSPTLTDSPAGGSACATCARAPTAPAPTARPSASSRRSPDAGPTGAPTSQAPSGPPTSFPGSSTTTSGDPTAASGTNRRARD